MYLPVGVTEELENQLAQVKEFIDVPTETLEGEKLAGEMTDMEKRIYTCALELRHRSSHPSLTAKEQARLEEMSKILRAFFWLIVKDNRPDLWGQHVGIRKGHELVIIPCRYGTSMLGFGISPFMPTDPEE